MSVRRPDTPRPDIMIDLELESAARALLALKFPMDCCPSCNKKGTYITHASKGLRTCNGCDDRFCTSCYFGSRYCCAYTYGKLPAPSTPLVRQTAIGVQTPLAEEKEKNK